MVNLHEGSLYTCDIICWGTPSPEVFARYIHWLDTKYGSKVIKYSHRMKSSRWKGARPAATFADGAVRWGLDVKLWQELWYGKLCRPSCHVCGYHSTNRPSNVTIGDYWGLEESHPGLTRGDGVSSLIVNDHMGSELMLACGRNLELVPSSMDLCANKSQPMLQHAPRPDADRDKF